MMHMRIANEKGIALVLSLFLMAAMSVHGGVADVPVADGNLLEHELPPDVAGALRRRVRHSEGGQLSALYVRRAGAPTRADPIANYNTNVSPVSVHGAGCASINQPVVLSANAAPRRRTIPIAAKQAAFLAAVQGTLPPATRPWRTAPYATLMSMQQIEVYGGGVQTIQTWQITSTGSITAGKTAQVEVSAILETPKFPAQTVRRLRHESRLRLV